MAKRDLGSLFMASTFWSLQVANEKESDTSSFNDLPKLSDSDIKSPSLIKVIEQGTNDNGNVVNKDNIYILYLRKLLNLLAKSIRIH